MRRISTPPESTIRERIVSGHRLTRFVETQAFSRLDQDRAGTLRRYWYSAFHKLLAHIFSVKALINIISYSGAIVLSSSGNLFYASIVAAVGIVVTGKISGLETALKARKLAYDSIEWHEDKKKRDRRRDPLT